VIRVWLIRHGEPVEEAKGRCYGSLDFGLSALGRDQMQQVARFLNSEPISAIYSSPRLRAREGAAILASGDLRPVEIIDDLREIAFGDFEGLTWDEIAAQYPVLYRQWMERPTETRFPNGEAFPEMRDRVLRAFESILRRHEDQTVALISHGGVNRVLIAGALQMPEKEIFRLAQDYGAINLLTGAKDGSCSLQLLNWSGAALSRL
jgi:alpha-ribazole phosphatase